MSSNSWLFKTYLSTEIFKAAKFAIADCIVVNFINIELLIGNTGKKQPVEYITTHYDSQKTWLLSFEDVKK